MTFCSYDKYYLQLETQTSNPSTHHFIPSLETKGPPLGLATALAKATQTTDLQGIPWRHSLAAGPIALSHNIKTQNEVDPQ